MGQNKLNLYLPAKGQQEKRAAAVLVGGDEGDDTAAQQGLPSTRTHRAGRRRFFDLLFSSFAIRQRFNDQHEYHWYKYLQFSASEIERE